MPKLLGMEIKRATTGTQDTTITTIDSKPVRPLSFESDFVVPVARTICGAGFSTVLGILAWFWYNGAWLEWWQNAVVFGLLTAMFWQSETQATTSTIYHTVTRSEPATDKEDKSTAVITPRAIVVNGAVLTRENAEEEEEQPERNDEEILEEIRRFVKMCEVDTSMRRLEPVFGRPVVTLYRDALIQAGLARWKKEDKPQAGWELAFPPYMVMEAVTVMEIADNST